MIRIAAFLILGLILFSCGETYSEEEKSDFDKRIERYLKKKKMSKAKLEKILFEEQKIEEFRTFFSQLKLNDQQANTGLEPKCVRLCSQQTH